VSFFESLLVLLLIAAVLLQASRRLSLPYPAMLAFAGVLVAFIPGSPDIGIEPQTALALFIAPIIVDAAYDFPPAAALRLLGSLLTFAVFAVIATTTLVAVLGRVMLHLPLAAAIALGAIVAPPDAAAASAVLSSIRVPRRVEELLKGESLFNDATALLLFSGALAVQAHRGMDVATGARLVAAVPGGVVLGVALAFLLRWVNSFFRDTLGGNLLQFVGTYLVWIAAERLGLSAVLCTIAFAMTLARMPEQRSFPRMRVQSFAVWSAVVFTLNVLAFLIMGMQARSLLSHMQGPSLRQSLRFSAVIVVTVILVRLLIVVAFHLVTSLIARRSGRPRKATLQEAIFVGWSGMRGFVTLATAFALPQAFPQRDTLVLTAFGVVLGTLVLQGLSLRPLIRWLGLDDPGKELRELTQARARLADAAIASFAANDRPPANLLRGIYELEGRAARDANDTYALDDLRRSGLSAIAAEREGLEAIRNRNEIGIGAYLQLQEEIDWRGLTLLRDEERRIEEV
jgi:CPA1 family monovalent cation:H+ antiporter